MKVLHVIPAVAPRYGGPSRALIEMCRALARKDIDILMATTDADGDGRLPVKLGERTEYESVPAIFFARQWSESLKFSRPLAAWLDANVPSFDLVHIHAVFSHACLSAARAARTRQVPYIIRPLGTLDPWSLQQKPFRKQIFWQLSVREMLKSAAAIHFTTEEEKQTVENSLGMNHGVVIPLGVEIPQPSDKLQFVADWSDELPYVDHSPHSFASASQRQTKVYRTDSFASTSKRQTEVYRMPYVLVLSRLHPKKNLDLLIKVFLDLTRQPELSDWRLIIAGAGDDVHARSLQSLVRKLNGDERVVFPGWLEGDERSSALRNAALLALPSKQENFGLCVAEAMAWGVPVLISEQVNLAGKVKAAQCGWIAPLDEAALGRALKEAMSDEDERRRRGEAGRDFAAHHLSWPRIADQLIELYKSSLCVNSAFSAPLP